MNLSTRIITILLALTWAVPAHSLVIKTEAGGLRAAIGASKDATELTVSGSLNLADFEFLALEMRKLSALDLSGTTVKPYKGTPTFTGRTSGAANMLPDYALLGMQLTTLRLPKGITAIGDGALGGIPLKAIEIPTTVTSIGNRAFAECTALEEVSLPASVSSIGEGAFKGCTALKTVVISGTPDSIASYTFAGCHSLATIELPSSIKTIGASAFNGCTSVGTMNFPAGLTRIGERAFNGSGLTKADLSACRSLSAIGDWSFAECSLLASVTLPAGLTRIGTGSFFNASSLTHTDLPKEIKRIPDFAFAGAAGNGNLIKDTKVKSIGKFSLADWSAVQVFTLPATLSEIEDGAMADWSKPDSIKGGTLIVVPALGADVWGALDKSDVVLTVKEELKNEFEATPQWQDFRIEIAKGETGNLPGISAGVSPAIEAYFDGMTLKVNAPVGITEVHLHDSAGRLYLLPASMGDDGKSMSIDTSAWDTRIMIVRVLLADGSAAALKLYR